MTTTKQRNQRSSIQWKKIVLPLVLLTLLSYLGVSTFVLEEGDNSTNAVQQAEAIQANSENTDLAEDGKTVQFAAPSEPENPFVHLQQQGSIPVPASVEPEVLTTSANNPDITDPTSGDSTVPGEVIVAVKPTVEPDLEAAVTSTASEPDSLTLIPTYSWVNAFSTETVFNGEPIAIGSIITAYDPDGVLIGRTTVISVGEYGAMAIYMDDPSTFVDEGAVGGDIIEFKINGLTAVVLGPSNPVWTENGGVLVLNLASGNLPG